MRAAQSNSAHATSPTVMCAVLTTSEPFGPSSCPNASLAEKLSVDTQVVGLGVPSSEKLPSWIVRGICP